MARAFRVSVHAAQVQHPGIGDRVEDVSGKAADFFRDNQFEFAHAGVVDHAVELSALFRGSPRDAFIGIDLIKAITVRY